MKRTYLNICTFVALALAATSCTMDKLVDSVYSYKPSNTITFGASTPQVEVITRGGESRGTTLDFTESALVSEDGQMSLPMMVKVEQGIHRAVAQQPQTRGEIMTDASKITTLSAWASAKKDGSDSWLYIDDVDFTRGSDGIYRSAEPYLWLDAATTLDFFTVANHTESFTPNFNEARDHITSFDYTVPANAAEQPDLLVAENLGVAGNSEASVPLEFKHILSAVNFKVGSKVVSGTIKSIKLKGVYNKGTYLLDEGQWVNRTIEGEGENKGVFNVPLPEGGVAVTAGAGEKTFVSTTSFMMIPQQFMDSGGVEIEFVDGKTGKEVSLYAPIQGNEWVMNTTTNYLINIDANYSLQIKQLDNVIDSHYVIAKVEVSSELDNWELTAYDTTGDDLEASTTSWSDSNDADITILREEEVNPMAKQGFWTDKVSERVDGKYVPTAISARGSHKIEDGIRVSGQVVYVFIPENVSGETRSITLDLVGYNDDILTGSGRKTITMTQESVKWINPTGDSSEEAKANYLGGELLIEGGQIPWGFNWNGLSEQFKITQGSGSPWGQIKNDVLPAMDKAGIDYNNFPEYIWMVTRQEDHKSEIILNIDYSKFATTLDLAKSETDGNKNTWQLYSFEPEDNFSSDVTGFALITSLKETITALGNVERVTVGEVGLINTLDKYAALYALKRNRFNIYIDSANAIYLPILEEKDANWYLPAKEQFVQVLSRAYWGQSFTWNDYYWTSTIHMDAENPTVDSGNAYMFTRGTASPADRTNAYLALAVRRYTETADVVIKPEDVVVPGAGENGPPSGSGGSTGGDTGGNQTGGAN